MERSTLNIVTLAFALLFCSTDARAENTDVENRAASFGVVFEEPQINPQFDPFEGAKPSTQLDDIIENEIIESRKEVELRSALKSHLVKSFKGRAQQAGAKVTVDPQTLWAEEVR